MNYLLALIPAIGWGIMPLITGKIGGSTINQMFGIGAGATIVGLVAFIIGHPTVTTDWILVLSIVWCFMDNWSNWTIRFI